MENQSTSICFFFPYKEDSGVPVLFYRLANKIAATHPQTPIYIVDYKDGAMDRHLQKYSNLKLIEFQDGQTVQLPQNTTLVMQSFVPYYWPKELQPDNNTKLFFWNLHFRNFVPSLLPFPGLRTLPTSCWPIYRFLSLLQPGLFNKLRKYVNLLIANHAIAFMDSTNYQSVIKYIFLKKQPKIDFLPVPVSPAKESIGVKKLAESDIIRFCWVGRLCDFKSYILIYTINQLAKIAPYFSKKIIYYIVGDGPLKEYIQRHISPGPNINVVFCGSIAHDKLDDFLSENVDILTAMGTSALEGAKLKLPTILLDASYIKIRRDYQYRLLYNTKDFDLAHEITSLDFAPNNHSLKDIINRIINDYESESTRTYQYYLNNHTIESVSEKFLYYVSSTRLTYGMIGKSLLKQSLFLRVYNKLRGLKK